MVILLFVNADDGRRGTFAIGDDHFPASLLDLPCIVESYKTYDDSVLIKTADVGQVRCVSYACFFLVNMVVLFQFSDVSIYCDR